MEHLSLNIHVGQLADIETPVNNILTSLEGKQYFSKVYDDLTFEIDYPIREKHRIKIKKVFSLADVLVPLAKEYKHVIYKDTEKYGVWGHDLGDLFFEGITINDDGTTELIMGS